MRGLRSPWTEAENQTIRDLYVKEGTYAVQAVLGRSHDSIQRQANRIGVVRFRRWTAKEKEQLKQEWGTVSLNEICRGHGRTKYGVYSMGISLGLTTETPQGYELLAHAADRVGYNTKTLLSILAASGFARRPVTTFGKKRRSKTRHWLVDAGEVDLAVETWLASEPMGTAATRYGLSRMTMKRWLEDAGLKAPEGTESGRWWRVPTETLERVIGGRIRSHLENTAQAARRHGLSQATMSLWLKEAGVVIARPVLLEPTLVDDVVAKRRQTAKCRNKGPR